MKRKPQMLVLDEEGRPSALVVGVGGAGCNAIMTSTMRNRIAVINEDQKVPNNGISVIRLRDSEIQVFKTTAPHLLINDFPIVRQIEERFRVNDVIFLFSGLGGETGSNATPVLASIARRHSGLVVSVVCTPFTVEGKDRRSYASESLHRLSSLSDICIVLSNDGLIQVAPQMQFNKAFKVMDQIMGFIPTELDLVLTRAGMRQLRDLFKECNCSRLGVGFGNGVFADRQALQDAFTSPWFDVELDKVDVCLALFAMSEADDQIVAGMVADLQNRVPNAQIVYSSRTDADLDGKIQATIVLGLR